MRFARVVFLIAGIHGVLILTPIYFMEGKIGRETRPAITHPEYFHGFLGAGPALQIVFLALSRDPLRYRAMILPSVLEKVSYGIALLVLFAQRRLPLSALTIGFVDSRVAQPLGLSLLPHLSRIFVKGTRFRFSVGESSIHWSALQQFITSWCISSNPWDRLPRRTRCPRGPLQRLPRRSKRLSVQGQE